MEYKFIKFGDEGFPLFYYDEITYPPIVEYDEETGEIVSIEKSHDIPNDAFSVSEEQWFAAQSAQLWLSPEKKITTPPKLPITEPETLQPLTPRQFRDALLDASILPSDVTEKINEIPFDIEREKALNAWNYASMFYRDDPYIDMIAAMFGMTPEQIDNLWSEAQEGER